jgi:hypothetical protein
MTITYAGIRIKMCNGFVADFWLLSGCPLLIFEGKHLPDSHESAMNQP